MEDLKEILKQVEENDCGGTNSEDCEKLMAFLKKQKKEYLINVLIDSICLNCCQGLTKELINELETDNLI